MGKGPLTIHGNRRLLAREHTAVAMLVIFGVLLIGTSILGYRHLYKRRRIATVTSTCILTLSLLRIALASMELHLDPLDTRRPRREQDFATLDAVALIPVMLMLLSHLFDYVHWSSIKYEEDLYENIKRWQLAALVAFGTVATIFYLAGCIVAFQVNRSIPQVLQTATILYVVMVLLILAGAVRLPMRSKADRAKVLAVIGGIVTVRLVWAVASAWSVDSRKSRFTPYRTTAAGAWTHLGVVLVMEFLISVMCSWFGGNEESMKEAQREKL